VACVRSRLSDVSFRFKIQAVLCVDHPLREKRFVTARDFAGETLITYPVPERRIELI
jgi:LysR family transcriptional regulator for metE and metH